MPVQVSLIPFLMAVALAAALGGCRHAEPAATASDAATCEVTRVIDGDTVDMRCAGAGSFRARLAGYDTPESYEPGCAAEADLARRATAELRALVRQAQSVDASLGGIDRYGRRLVRLRLDGVDVAGAMTAAGLAVRYSGGRRIDWCARLS